MAGSSAVAKNSNTQWTPEDDRRLLELRTQGGHLLGSARPFDGLKRRFRDGSMFSRPKTHRGRGLTEYRVMNSLDQEVLLSAIEDARHILGEYVVLSSRDSARTVERLRAVLDNENVVRALEVLKRRSVVRLVE